MSITLNALINLVRSSTLEALFTSDVLGSEPVVLDAESYVLDSRIDVSTQCKLKLIDHIKPGYLCGALDDLDAIGTGLPQMTVR